MLRALHGGLHRADLPDSEEEIRKQITTILGTTTGTVVVWDNITAPLKSGQLANLLTTSEWNDRRLGVTGDVTARNDRLFVATGNNMLVTGDLPRRVIWITIDADQDRPWERDGFTIPDPEGYVRTNQGRLLGALITVARGWVVAGMPSEHPRGDDYGRLTAAVRGILTFAGVDGIFNHAETAATPGNADDGGWGDFYRALEARFEGRPFTAADLTSALDEDSAAGQTAGAMPLRAALPAELLLKLPDARLSAISLAMLLRNRNRRFVDGLAVETLPVNSANSRRYRIVRAGERPHGINIDPPHQTTPRQTESGGTGTTGTTATDLAR
jgi:hypothetical protein